MNEPVVNQLKMKTEIIISIKYQTILCGSYVFKIIEDVVHREIREILIKKEKIGNMGANIYGKQW